MADDTMTIAGSHKKAISDGTALREKMKELSKNIRRTLLLIVGAAVLIWAGYHFFSWVRSDPSDYTSEKDKIKTDLAKSVPAKSFGQIIAPVGTWSAWLVYPVNRCANWWTDDPEMDDVHTRFTDRNTGDVWSGSSKGHDVASSSWKSKFRDRPVRITYQLVPRSKDGSCPDF